MLYQDYLKSLTRCPFCNVSDRVILSTENCYLTYAWAPYHKHHLLVIPKKHRTSLFDLDINEKEEVDLLVGKAMTIIKKLGYKDFTVIVREGEDHAKTISHLHYHIIPNTHIGDLDHKGNERRVLSDQEVKNLVDEINSVKV